MGTSSPIGHSPKPHSLTVQALIEMIFVLCLSSVSISQLAPNCSGVWAVEEQWRYLLGTSEFEQQRDVEHFKYGLK